MTKFDEILDLMESFPSTFAQPELSISPQHILDFAAELREKAGLGTKPELPPMPGTGALPPPGWVHPEVWDNPHAYDDPVTGHRYTGSCNGCGAPIYVIVDSGLPPIKDGSLSNDEKEFLSKSTLQTLKGMRWKKPGRYEVWVGHDHDGEADMEFDTMGEALDFVNANGGPVSMAIKYPNGDWHNWKGD